MSKSKPTRLPRLAEALLASVLLFILAQLVVSIWPTSHLAVSLYKLHLCSLAAWAGYWIDRALFPYSRPHEFFEGVEAAIHGSPSDPSSRDAYDEVQICGSLDSAEAAMFRRAAIVVGCLICVGLGA
jgi:hypothetical protein